MVYSSFAAKTAVLEHPWPDSASMQHAAYFCIQSIVRAVASIITTQAPYDYAMQYSAMHMQANISARPQQLSDVLEEVMLTTSGQLQPCEWIAAANCELRLTGQSEDSISHLLRSHFVAAGAGPHAPQLLCFVDATMYLPFSMHTCVTACSAKHHCNAFLEADQDSVKRSMSSKCAKAVSYWQQDLREACHTSMCSDKAQWTYTEQID